METHHHEWILTNRLGGYALGMGNLVSQRKYHGLLVTSDKQFQRNHLVAGMEELIEWRGESFHLDTNNYENCLYPEGFLHLVKSWLRPYPIFLYSSLPHNDDIMIRKEIMMDEQSNTVLIRFTNLSSHKLHFTLRPKYTMRNHHDLNTLGSFDTAQMVCQQSHVQEGTNFDVLRPWYNLRAFGYMEKGEVWEDRLIYRKVYYPWEVMGGYEGVEDQIALYKLVFELGVGESNYILFSDEPIDEATTLIKTIEARYSTLPRPKDYPMPQVGKSLLESLDFDDTVLFDRKQYLQLLEFALKDFIANDDIVAGYPWFGAWGRDTMFALNAFMHMPKMIDQCEQILMKYSEHIKDGLIPNVLPESGREGNYDSIDATLWYVILLWKLGRRKEQQSVWQKVSELSHLILSSLHSQLGYPFRFREDGLLEILPEFAHATWMDVRMDGKAVTPRDGAPVEINALYYNAVCAYEEMVKALQRFTPEKQIPDPLLLQSRDLVKQSFQKFWIGDYLADRLCGDEPVREIRPNALIAASLPFPLIKQEQIQAVHHRAKAELYTPYGIRTLSPFDVKFRRKYYGTQRERDMSYHQGAVWAWLLGPFAGTYRKAWEGVKSEEEIFGGLEEIIGTFQLSFMKGHIASIAEVWDGDIPHFPKGAPAQAWSVAALYNIESYLTLSKGEEK